MIQKAPHKIGEEVTRWKVYGATILISCKPKRQGALSLPLVQAKKGRGAVGWWGDAERRMMEKEAHYCDDGKGSLLVDIFLFLINFAVSWYSVCFSSVYILYYTWSDQLAAIKLTYLWIVVSVSSRIIVLKSFEALSFSMMICLTPNGSAPGTVDTRQAQFPVFTEEGTLILYCVQ